MVKNVLCDIANSLEKSIVKEKIVGTEQSVDSWPEQCEKSLVLPYCSKKWEEGNKKREEKHIRFIVRLERHFGQ